MKTRSQRPQSVAFVYCSMVRIVRYKRPLCEVSAGAKSNEASRNPTPALITFSGCSPPEILEERGLSLGSDLILPCNCRLQFLGFIKYHFC